MSQNRSDWFNPNNPAYGIRQSQVRGNFTYSGLYSSPVHRCYYPRDTVRSRSNKDIPFTLPDEVKEYLSYDEEKGDLKFTFEGLMLIIDFAERRERNYRRMVGK